jgi:molybdate transport system regulatory protein
VRSSAAAIEFRLRISKGEDIAIGPGKVDLLEAIAATGSITAAAKQLGMSYRRAWMLVDTMNRCFTNPVVEAEAGGRRGGGTRLTQTGASVLRLYRRIESKAHKSGAADLATLTELLVR